MSSTDSPQDRDAAIDAKLEQLYAAVRRKYPDGPVADEAADYYDQAARYSGEDKLYYLRLLASMLEDF